MDIKILEEKLHYCQENLNFVSRELLKIKDKEIGKSKCNVGDIVYDFMTDIHYEKGYIVDKSFDREKWRWNYYVHWDYSSLIKNKSSTSWVYDERHLHKSLEDLKIWMKDRIDLWVI